MSAAQTPGALHYLLDIQRINEDFSEEPHGLIEEYTVYRESGDNCRISIDHPALAEDLRKLRSVERDPADMQRVGNRLREVLLPGGWAVVEQDLKQARENRQRVIITNPVQGCRDSRPALGITHPRRGCP